jgi:hypothetical protein
MQVVIQFFCPKKIGYAIILASFLEEYPYSIKLLLQFCQKLFVHTWVNLLINPLILYYWSGGLSFHQYCLVLIVNEDLLIDSESWY